MMKTTLGRSILLVDDYDQAFDFYRKNFFCEKLFDAETTDGQRFLHIRFSGDEQSGIWFLKADSKEQRALLGKQTGGQPTLVIYTDDCKGLFDHVKTNGLTIIEPMETAGGSTYFHCADLYGNRLTIVELESR
ncbi:VOC family protein [Chitinophaga flava]|uniref:Bleomycin resistance protein n=1 Tax=Chitinophaga flava TaxID=2259036 RepID=A0A365XXL6_9BACT|nr:VOC family protein [Chitinophaga flava]RBL91129.1 bleomycin resistance protein [Chitinophaga flava]